MTFNARTPPTPHNAYNSYNDKKKWDHVNISDLFRKDFTMLAEEVSDSDAMVRLTGAETKLSLLELDEVPSITTEEYLAFK